jgi:hypothetical protein
MAIFHMATPAAKESFDMACFYNGFSGFGRMFPMPLTTEALIGIFEWFPSDWIPPEFLAL